MPAETELCPFCDQACAGERPMCTKHWGMTDAVTKVNFIAAQQTYERNIYRGDSLDAFSQACNAAVDYVRNQLENSETP